MWTQPGHNFKMQCQQQKIARGHTDHPEYLSISLSMSLESNFEKKCRKERVPLWETGAAAGPDGALGDAADHDIDAVALAGVAHPVGSHETLPGQVTPDGHNLPKPKFSSVCTDYQFTCIALVEETSSH